MIATFFLIIAFIRSIPWSRRRIQQINDEHEHSIIESKDKLSSLGHSMFSRSDSSATTTSSSGAFKRRGDSTASTISTSVFSEIAPNTDVRRSSDSTRFIIQQQQQQQQIQSQNNNANHRRSSGRIRKFTGSRTTIAGARRRTTGRFEHTKSHHFIRKTFFLLFSRKINLNLDHFFFLFYYSLCSITFNSIA